MLVAGFDVGIKNLAFCIIDSKKWKDYKKNECGNCGIILWENINTLGEPSKCNGLIKSGVKKGSECNKIAKWQKNDQFYCGTHKSTDCKKYIAPKITRTKMPEIKKQAFTMLDKYAEYFKDVKKIVIETQPRINGSMKLFACSLEAYFILRYQMCENPVLKSIQSSSARNKLKVYKGPKINTDDIKDPYQKRKFLATQHTEYLLKNDSQILDKYYKHSKKQDDLSDAFLHCVWAINKLV